MKQLTNEQIETLTKYATLGFTFEDCLLVSSLGQATGDLLKEAETHFRKGKIQGEAVVRSSLFKEAQAGNVGAGKELLKSIEDEKKEKKTLRATFQ